MRAGRSLLCVLFGDPEGRRLARCLRSVAGPMRLLAARLAPLLVLVVAFDTDCRWKGNITGQCFFLDSI